MPPLGWSQGSQVLPSLIPLDRLWKRDGQPTASNRTIVRSKPRTGSESRARLALFGSLVFLPALASGPNRPADAINPLELSAAMREWSRSAFATGGDELEGLRHLLGLLTEGGSAAIREIPGPTPTAAEAFASRQADCVGFALLFVALGRAADLEVEFVLSTVVERIDDDGTLRIRRSHLAAVHGDRVFDLGGEWPFDPALHRRVSDRTATAIFLSNRGAQSLAAGRLHDAIEVLWRALRFDPSLSWVWTNLGVALRRAGDSTGAVLAHEMALRLDPADSAARRNLDVALTAPRRRAE